MNRMISLTRIMFAGLGIYLGITICGGIVQSVIFIFNDLSLENVGNVSIMLILSIVMLAVVVLVLFVKGDHFARKLITKDIDSDKPLELSLTLAMAFRLVCVGAGLLCVRTLIFQVGRIVSLLMRSKQFSGVISGRGQLYEYFQMTLLIALAFYLLCGAPHFVRWQVKKTMKLCSEK